MRSERVVTASDFKAKCLSLIDEVSSGGQELIITKRGKPVARLVPMAAERRALRGAWKGHVRVTGDIVHVDWSEEFEAAR